MLLILFLDFLSSLEEVSSFTGIDIDFGGLIELIPFISELELTGLVYFLGSFNLYE